ncbi:hypothetical protein OPV22_007587 [Ensete ventricosum]|uniref:Secreted protein n=1 Tax=Ensete ventricosum TaxID=4639 RepID=A0AAV8RTS3_ENSVE|nr:hypothetical protein OPV22_007587 [Ensete ventricosum]
MREAATATALLLFSLEARRVKESGGGVLLASGSVDPEEGDEAWDVAGAANDNRSRGGQACNKAGASEAGRILNVRRGNCDAARHQQHQVMIDRSRISRQRT